MQFRRLVGALPAAAYACDADGLITYFNKRAVELWGRAPKLNDAADRYCGSFRLFSPDDGSPVAHDRCWMALALSEGKAYEGREIIIERPDGSRRVASAYATPFHDGNGRVIGAANVLMDITGRKRAEQALREADRNKNDFLAMLAHELRNPLAPLRNGLQVMQLAGNTGPLATQARQMMERQLGHMVRLIDDLLDLSRITKGRIELRKENIDLATAVRDAVETSRPLIENAGHELAVTLPPTPVFVMGDRTRLAQVFGNLLNNSAKYTPQGGRIALHVERQGTDVAISVTDNGVGIPPDMQARIFDMFAQVDHSLERSRSGLGIGLSLVRGLIEMHDGTVEARSEGPGKGSEFVVRLSVAVPPAQEPALEGETGERAAGLSGYRILVVDDNEDSALSLAMMLTLMGHATRTAHDGALAIDVARDLQPHVMLLDIGLPKLNGYEVCRRVRAEAWGADIVLIALTGWGYDEDKQRSKEAGFNFHMVKPVDPAALEKLLAGLLLSPN